MSQEPPQIWRKCVRKSAVLGTCKLRRGERWCQDRTQFKLRKFNSRVTLWKWGFQGRGSIVRFAGGELRAGFPGNWLESHLALLEFSFQDTEQAAYLICSWCVPGHRFLAELGKNKAKEGRKETPWSTLGESRSFPDSETLGPEQILRFVRKWRVLQSGVCGLGRGDKAAARCQQLLTSSDHLLVSFQCITKASGSELELLFF